MNITPTQNTIILSPVHDFTMPDKSHEMEPMGNNDLEPLAAFKVEKIGPDVENIKEGSTVYICPYSLSQNMIGDQLFYTCCMYSVRFTLD